MDKDIRRSMNLLTLRIKDQKVEKAYQNTIAKESIIRYRIAMVSGILFYVVAMLVDQFTYPTVHEAFNLIRMAFITPCLMVIFLLTFTRLYKQYTGMFNVIAVYITGFGIVLMAYFGQNEPEISRIYVGLIIVFFYLYAFMNISFFYGFVIGSSLMCGYLWIAWQFNQLPFEILMNMIYMLGVSNLVGVTVAYIMEYHSKNSYLLKAQLSETIIQDALTGLYNRHYFEKVVEPDIQEFIERSKGLEGVERRHNQLKMAKYGMFMVDIDHFKRINDTFGHHSGDLVLKQIAQLLKENVRHTDSVLRFGGEEFLLIVKYTTQDYLNQLMKKIGRMVELEDFLIEGGSIIGCTVSMGLVIVPEDAANSVDDLLRFSDRALYRSKDTGRNKGNRAYAQGGKMHYEEVPWSQ